MPPAPETRLAILTLGVPAFHPAERGAVSSRPIQQDEGAEREGKARWFRLITAAGTAVAEGTAGERDADLVLEDADIKLGAVVRVTSIIHGEPKK